MYCAQSTPSTLVSPLTLVALLPCATEEPIGRCSDVGTTTVSRPDERFWSRVLYSASHLPRNSTKPQCQTRANHRHLTQTVQEKHSTNMRDEVHVVQKWKTLITALKFLAKEQRNAETSYNCKNSLTATWLPVTQCACHQLQSIQTAVTQLQSLICDTDQLRLLSIY